MVNTGGSARPVSYPRQLYHQHQQHHEAYQQRIRTRRRPPPPRIFIVILLTLWLPALEIPGVLACGPGRGGGRRPILRKLTPLVFKQHVPNVSENTLPASGLAEDKVSRHDARFRDLVPNYNADIIFKDEEGTGADRLMTQRCKEKLNTLAISVMNQWPGVKLRVTEGWDEDPAMHAKNSLHYEGRAVDVTTSDRDRSKYGMLARLAVEAGFDWVYYESRSHIHCSVKSEKSFTGKSGGCFPGNSAVITSNGHTKLMSELRVGESVASLDSSGEVVYSEVIAFLDRAPDEKRQYVKLRTTSGKVLTLTPLHLVPVERGSGPDQSSQTIFASRVAIGDRILVRDSDKTLPSGSRVRWELVEKIELSMEEGMYAPLTREGTVVVDDVVASCYAVFESQTLDHLAFLPFRIMVSVQSSLAKVGQFFLSLFEGQTKSNDENFIATNEVNGNIKNIEDRRWRGPEGIHWYAAFLHSTTSFFLPSILH